MDEQQARLRRVRGEAPAKSPTVRVLAAAPRQSDCPVAKVGLASCTDLDKLCDNSDYEAPFGQDPQAFQRGEMFERRVKEQGYAELLRLLRDQAGFPLPSVRIEDLRSRAPKNAQGLRLREVETRRLLRKIARQEPDAPNLIDGAVLRVQIGSCTAYFEADGLAAAASGQIHVAEVKSFPITDGRCDGDKLGAAVDQAAWYALLCRLTLQAMGFSGDEVARSGFIVLPQGVGLQPTLLRQSLDHRIRRAQLLLQTAQSAGERLRDVDGIAFPAPDDDDRFEKLEDLLDRLGTSYRGECLADCGLARLCRARAHARSQPSLCGGRVTQQMPGILTLHRAGELVRGAPPAPIELHAASTLAMAGRLYDRVMREGGL